jgi:glycosyltransferase involved in cell wall biosynthesis
MISVCIATYNASKYIHAQIVSILDQLGPDDEIVISDDASTDDTINIIKNINDLRIKILVGTNKLGIVKNFERALYAAKGKFIFLSDQDDLWLPNKVLECTKQLERNILVVTDCIVVDDKLNTLHESYFLLRNSKRGVLHNIYKNSYIGCCMAFKKELLSYALPIPKDVSMHDVWLGLLAELNGSVCFLPKKLMLYRRHNNNASLLKSNFSLLKKLQLRINLLLHILLRLIKIYTSKLLKIDLNEKQV